MMQGGKGGGGGGEMKRGGVGRELLHTFLLLDRLRKRPAPSTPSYPVATHPTTFPAAPPTHPPPPHAGLQSWTAPPAAAAPLTSA